MKNILHNLLDFKLEMYYIIYMICSHCLLELDGQHFRKRADRASGYTSWCKLCLQEKEKASYINGSKKIYYSVNKEHIRNIHKRWEVINKTKLAKYKRERRQNSTDEQIKNRLRRRIKEILGTKKNKTSYKYTGINIDKLKQHLQQTAINNGYKNFNIEHLTEEYHIDHVVPCSIFNLSCSYHQKLCFNWTNLQILSAKDNLLKGDNYGN